MADIKQIQVGQTIYDIKDEVSRNGLATKQDALTFDSTPTSGSSNPVTSDGVSTALTAKADQSTTYTKTEVNNLIVPANTTITVVTELPASGTANTIYRVQGTDSYTDYGWDGTQFVALATYNGTNLYDSTGSNTDGAMTQKSITDEIISDRVWGYTQLSIPSPSQSADLRYIVRSTLKWGAQTTYASGVRRAIVPGKTYKIVGNATYAGKWAWLETNVNTSDTDPSFPPGCTLETIGANQTLYVVAPAEANYIYLEKKSGGNSVIASYLGEVIFTKEHIEELDTYFTDEILALDTRLDSYNDRINNATYYKYTEITYPSGTTENLKSIIDGVWTGNTSYHSGMTIGIVSGKTYKLTSKTEYSTQYAWLSSFDRENGSTPPYVEDCVLTAVAKDTTIYITAPSTAKYLYVRRTYGGNWVIPTLWLADTSHEYLEKVEDLETAVLNNADFIPEDETVTPLSEETYNVDYFPNASPDNIFRGIGDYQKRLAYFPKVRIAGGGTLKFTMTGQLGVSVVELPWRELDRAPNYAYYKNTDVINRVSYSAAPREVELTLNKKTRRIVIHTSTSSSSISPASITDYITSVTLPVAKLENFTFSNDDTSTDDELMLIKHTTMKPPANSGLPYLNLLHYSDIHCSTTAAGNIIKASKKYVSYISDVLNTGDVVYSVIGGAYNGDNDDWYEKSGLQNISLFTPGNHDDLISTTTRERYGKSYLHTKYFPQIVINALKITMPTGYTDSDSANYQACYWYKDYTAQKVRLIGLDCMDKCDGVVNPATGEIETAGTTGNEQELWLVERLAETLPNSGNTAEGYSVVVCGHYPLDGYSGDNKKYDNSTLSWVYNQNALRDAESGVTPGGRVFSEKTNAVMNFHRRSASEYSPNPTMRWANSDDINNIANILDYYAHLEGSNFIAYLGGHVHNNLFFYPTKYPDLLNICVDMAGHLREMYYADQVNMGGFVSNLISFNTSGKLIKIARLGVKSDVWLTPLNYICYDYVNRKVVSEG